MLSIKDGQCGRCTHFGEQHPSDPTVVQIRIKGVAPEGYTDRCGHPTHAPLRLEVAPNSTCSGFRPAKVA